MPVADTSMDTEIIALRRRGETVESVARQLQIKMSRVYSCLRRHNMQIHRGPHKTRRREALPEVACARALARSAQPLSRTAESTRFSRVRDLEHHIRCWVHAYVTELEGRGFSGGGARPLVLRSIHWQALMDVMLGILVQEGKVERLEDESCETNTG